jgi:hypothetical protein
MTSLLKKKKERLGRALVPFEIKTNYALNEKASYHIA